MASSEGNGNTPLQTLIKNYLHEAHGNTKTGKIPARYTERGNWAPNLPRNGLGAEIPDDKELESESVLLYPAETDREESSDNSPKPNEISYSSPDRLFDEDGREKIVYNIIEDLINEIVPPEKEVQDELRLDNSQMPASPVLSTDEIIEQALLRASREKNDRAGRLREQLPTVRRYKPQALSNYYKKLLAPDKQEIEAVRLWKKEQEFRTSMKKLRNHIA